MKSNQTTPGSNGRNPKMCLLAAGQESCLDAGILPGCRNPPWMQESSLDARLHVCTAAQPRRRCFHLIFTICEQKSDIILLSRSAFAIMTFGKQEMFFGNVNNLSRSSFLDSLWEHHYYYYIFFLCVFANVRLCSEPAVAPVLLL